MAPALPKQTKAVNAGVEAPGAPREGSENHRSAKVPAVRARKCHLSLVPSHHDHAIGERIGIRLNVNHVVTFQREERAKPRGRKNLGADS